MRIIFLFSNHLQPVKLIRVSLIRIHYYKFADIDECKIQANGGCHPDARCNNNVGSFTCQCKPG